MEMDDEAQREARRRQFEAVWSENVRIVEQICWLYLRNQEDVRDAVQRVRIRKWIHFEKYNPEIGFAAWVRTNARHVCIEAYRRSQRRVPEEELPGGDGEYLVGEEATYFEDDQILGRISNPDLVEAVLELPDPLRLVLICRFLDALTLQETALQLQITFSQVRTRETRALEQLRRRLG